MVSLCGGGPNTKTNQLLIVLKPNYWADTGMGAGPFDAPVARVVHGMDVLDRLYSGYGDIVGMCDKGCNGPKWNATTPACQRWCNAPDQGRLMAEGNKFIPKEFPHLDFIEKCTLL